MRFVKVSLNAISQIQRPIPPPTVENTFTSIKQTLNSLQEQNDIKLDSKLKEITDILKDVDKTSKDAIISEIKSGNKESVDKLGKELLESRRLSVNGFEKIMTKTGEVSQLLTERAALATQQHNLVMQTLKEGEEKSKEYQQKASESRQESAESLKELTQDVDSSRSVVDSIHGMLTQQVSIMSDFKTDMRQTLAALKKDVDDKVTETKSEILNELRDVRRELNEFKRTMETAVGTLAKQSDIVQRLDKIETPVHDIKTAMGSLVSTESLTTISTDLRTNIAKDMESSLKSVAEKMDGMDGLKTTVNGISRVVELS